MVAKTQTWQNAIQCRLEVTQLKRSTLIRKKNILLWSHTRPAWPDWAIYSWWHILIKIVVPIFGVLGDILKNISFQIKLLYWLLSHFWKHLGYFLFQHLVTLLETHWSHEELNCGSILWLMIILLSNVLFKNALSQAFFNLFSVF